MYRIVEGGDVFAKEGGIYRGLFIKFVLLGKYLEKTRLCRKSLQKKVASNDLCGVLSDHRENFHNK